MRRLRIVLVLLAAIVAAALVAASVLGGPSRREVVEAARACDVAELQRLLAAGASASEPVRGLVGWQVGEPHLLRVYPVTAAAEAGCVEALRLLHAHGASLEAEDSWEMTPLSLAAREGRAEAVAWLLAQGVNLHGRTYGGYTALHWAAAMGDAATVDVLLRAGAHRGVVGRHGSTPADLARGRRGAEGVAIRELLASPEAGAQPPGSPEPEDPTDP